MADSLISIIIPTYNRAHLIGETLESIIAQTYQNWECIIVDDGSTDDTETILARYLKKDIRFQYHKRPKSQLKGANACRNYGFEISNGKYIKWFDSDDLMLPAFLHKQISFLENNQKYDFVTTMGKEFRVEKNKKIITNKLEPKVVDSKHIIYDYVIGNIFFITNSPLWRKTFLEDKELFNPRLNRSQEAEFNFRMLLKQPKFKYLNYYGFLLRRGHDSIDSQSQFSLQKQQSVAYYYNLMFQSLLHVEFDKKQKTLHYIFFRQAVNVYNILSFAHNQSSRLQEYDALTFDIYQYANELQLSSIDKVKLKTGLFLTKTFGKGYQLLYFKKFDCR